MTTQEIDLPNALRQMAGTLAQMMGDRLRPWYMAQTKTTPWRGWVQAYTTIRGVDLSCRQEDVTGDFLPRLTDIVLKPAAANLVEMIRVDRLTTFFSDLPESELVTLPESELATGHKRWGDPVHVVVDGVPLTAMWLKGDESESGRGAYTLAVFVAGLPGSIIYPRTVEGLTQERLDAIARREPVEVQAEFLTKINALA